MPNVSSSLCAKLYAIYAWYTQFIFPSLDVSFSGMLPNLSIYTFSHRDIHAERCWGDKSTRGCQDLVLVLPIGQLSKVIACPYGGHDRLKGWLNSNQRMKQKVWHMHLMTVQDYDLYWIHIDYSKRMWLQYAFNCILSDIITVEYDTITLWLQYNMTPVFNHNQAKASTLGSNLGSTTQF